MLRARSFRSDSLRIAQESYSKSLLHNKLSGFSDKRFLNIRTAILGIAISLFAFSPSQAKAESPFVLASVVSQAPDIKPIRSFPNLLGSTEKKSTDISAFKKWTGMISRFEKQFSQNKGQLNTWRQKLSGMQNLKLSDKVRAVNSYVNNFKYITDDRNWGRTDYWATPVEFFDKGGDCEDYAIAKYASLRALGVPDNRMRIAIVQDLKKNIPHAVLIVYTDEGAMMLDNQNKHTLNGSNYRRYKPIFSINQKAWWLHTS